MLLLAQAAQLTEHLFGRLLADMAGVEDDHVGISRVIGRGKAERGQDVRHAGGVVDVHLATVGLDEEFLGQIAYASALWKERRSSLRKWSMQIPQAPTLPPRTPPVNR